ncbi:MAG: serine/threonine protein kinase [Deltaproteobacteria bacterium]|nr:serine/threonine protein kinase [Deltaproteobacteria bacterium]
MYTADDLPLEIPPGGVNITGLPLTLMKVLGKGGQGLVYLGYRPTMDRYEVVKFPDISPEAPHAVEDFRREIHALSRLKCESIVTIYIVDVLQTGRLIGRPYFTMEHVEGGSLRSRLRGEPLPVRQALTFAIDIADALSAAHAAGIVHRDIKPQNVLLTREGKAKLIDFGLARIINESRRHTAGFIRGTPKYMCPEAARAEVVGPQGDLYSLGALLFEMLTGRPPFDGNEYDLMLHHATTPAPSLREIGRGGPFPVELEGVMRSLLAKQIHERPQSAGGLRRVLEGIRRLVPDDSSRIDEVVDSQDPTLSAAAATVHGRFPVAIAATRDSGGPGAGSYRTDDATVDARATGLDQTRDQSVGRTGVVPKDASSDDDEHSAQPRREQPLPIAELPKHRAPLAIVALLALLMAGALGAAVFALTRGPRAAPVPTPSPSAAPSAAPTVSVAATLMNPPPATVTASPPQPSAAPPGPVTAPVTKLATTSKLAVTAPTLAAPAATTAAAAPPPAISTAAPAPPPPAPTKSPIDDRF